MASYIIHMVGGVILENVEDTTMFQMLEKMQVECVCKQETGEVVYTNPAFKPSRSSDYKEDNLIALTEEIGGARQTTLYHFNHDDAWNAMAELHAEKAAGNDADSVTKTISAVWCKRFDRDGNYTEVSRIDF